VRDRTKTDRQNTTERNESNEEVLLKRLKRPFSSFDQLLSRCLPTLAARLWATCCWPDSMSDGWKIGDYNFLILSASPEKDTDIYIQFWSEPGEVVCAEVGSGEWLPGTLKYVGQPQRDFLAALGYAIGGEAGNFQKEFEIDSSARAEAAAREVLQILYEGFGYRGQWPLELTLHRGERADLAPTYASVTPEDFAKLAEEAGFETACPGDTEEDAAPIVLFRRRRHHAAAIFDGRTQERNLYSCITLRTALAQGFPDDIVEELNATMRLLRFRRDDGDRLLAELPLSLTGGVTAVWLIEALKQWVGGCRGAERILKRKVSGAGGKSADRRVESIH
jgi:hypothetical protein